MFRRLASRNEHADWNLERVLAGLPEKTRYKTTKRFGVDGGEAAVAGAPYATDA